MNASSDFQTQTKVSPTPAWQGDRDYHDRHRARSLRRARCIEGYLDGATSFLDVGCNRGLTTSYLLMRGKIKRATGVELAKGAVADELLRDERFSLLSGDICDIALTGTFDSVFYGAVHHHIMRERGLAAAVSVLQKLVDHCSHQLFFETGHLTEGGRWSWQRSIRQYFRTDEEHLFFLLRHIEPRINSVEMIGRFPIHLARRWLIRIEVKPLAQARPNYPSDAEALGDRKVRWYSRTFGSRDQRSCELKPGETALTEYGETADGREPRLFIKRRPLAPHVDEDEYRIAMGARIKHVVQPLCFEPTLGIVYPFIQGLSVLDWIRQNKSKAYDIGASIAEVFREAHCHEAPPAVGVLLSAGRRRLVDVVDMNPNNFIVSDTPSGPILHWIDLERQSTHYLWKNSLHVANVLVRVKGYRLMSLGLYIQGAVKALGLLFKYQLVGPRNRVAARQPSVLSFVIAGVRSAVGGLAIRVLPSLSRP